MVEMSKNYPLNISVGCALAGVEITRFWLDAAVSNIFPYCYLPPVTPCQNYSKPCKESTKAPSFSSHYTNRTVTGNIIWGEPIIHSALHRRCIIAMKKETRFPNNRRIYLFIRFRVKFAIWGRIDCRLCS